MSANTATVEVNVEPELNADQVNEIMSDEFYQAGLERGEFVVSMLYFAFPMFQKTKYAKVVANSLFSCHSPFWLTMSKKM
mgnify:CR=1 FL=1